MKLRFRCHVNTSTLQFYSCLPFINTNKAIYHRNKVYSKLKLIWLESRQFMITTEDHTNGKGNTHGGIEREKLRVTSQANDQSMHFKRSTW